MALAAAELALLTVGHHASQGQWLELWKWLLTHKGERAPSEFTGWVMFDVFSFERELVIDAMERQTGVDLVLARHSGSIRSLSDKAVTAINRECRRTGLFTNSLGGS